MASRPRRTRETTIYDAVAGLLTTRGFNTLDPTFDPLQPPPLAPHPIGPDEALGRRLNHPPDGIPYEDNKSGLPDSLLLRAIHQYAIDYYASKEEEYGAGWGRASMDESALLAIGMLLEEEVRGLLGDGGGGAMVDQDEWDGWMVGEDEEGSGEDDLDEGDDDDQIDREEGDDEQNSNAQSVDETVDTLTASSHPLSPQEQPPSSQPKLAKQKKRKTPSTSKPSSEATKRQKSSIFSTKKSQKSNSNPKPAKLKHKTTGSSSGPTIDSKKKKKKKSSKQNPESENI